MASDTIGYTRAPDRHYDFDVSVLGLGAMGARMARALVAAGKRVTVWNRSQSKAEALEANGAHRSETAQEALLASPVSVVVLLDNAAVHDVLDAVDQSRVFRDRIVVNFTTNSKEESEALDTIIGAGGGHQVKATIVAYPRNIGHPDSYAIYTGDPDAVRRCSDLLKILAPNSVILPREEAYALSTSLHVYAFAAMAAFYEAVAASHYFGIPPAKMARLVSDTSGFFVADAIRDATQRLETSDFTGGQARLDVHASAFEYLADAMHRQGAATPIFDAVCEATRRAANMGYGGNDIAAMTDAYISRQAGGETSRR